MKRNRTKFGISVAKIFVEHNLTLTEASEKIGVNPKYLSDVLFGKRNPTPELVMSIVREFHIRGETGAASQLYEDAGASMSGVITIQLDGLDEYKKKMLFELADKIAHLDDDAIDVILGMMGADIDVVQAVKTSPAQEG